MELAPLQPSQEGAVSVRNGMTASSASQDKLCCTGARNFLSAPMANVGLPYALSQNGYSRRDNSLLLTGRYFVSVWVRDAGLCRALEF